MKSYTDRKGRKVSRLRLEAPTWLAHAAIASLITIALDPFLPAGHSAAWAVWGYAFREADQLVRKWLKEYRAAKWLKPGEVMRRTPSWFRLSVATGRWWHGVNWLGSAGDVVAPALAAAFVTWRYTAVFR